MKQIPKKQLDLNWFKDTKSFLEFINWLIEERDTSPNSALVYLHHAISILKYLFKEEAKPGNNYKELNEIGQLRDIAVQLAALKKNYKKKGITEEEIQNKQKKKSSMDWSLIVQATRQLYDKYQKTESVKDLQDYIAIVLAVLTPPGRAQMFRDLELDKTIFKENTKWTICFEKYKTFKKFGTTKFLVHEKIQGAIEHFVNKKRDQLLGIETHKFFFCQPNNGQKFTGPCWTIYVQKILQPYLGEKVGPTLLRHSFVTKIYEEETSESLKNSAAIAMKHGKDIQRNYYNDGGNADEKLAEKWADDQANDVPNFIISRSNKKQRRI
jgi:hypothetical protein